MNKQKLVDDFCPVLKFHPDEKNFPCSIEFLLKNSLLCKDKNEITKKYGILTPDNIDEEEEKCDLPCYLDIRKSSWCGEKENLHNVPIYATVFQNNKYYQIHYIFLYTYNAPYKILDCIDAGEHQSDLEHITLFVSKQTMKIESAYYSAHEDGMWLHHSDLEMDGDHPTVYVAFGSHACYNKAKTYLRIFGFANDHTSNKGIHLRPKVEYINDKTKWNKYKGYLGKPNNCQTPMYREWWGHENGKNTNFWKRFFKVS